MDYSVEFKNFIARCLEMQAKDHNKDIFIGGGNPMSPVLFVGQEPSGNNRLSFLDSWKERINTEFDPIIRKNTFPSQHLWRNYQRLYEYIQTGTYNKHPEYIDFESHVFTTEMSGIASSSNSDARLMSGHNEELTWRKASFFKDEYIQSFPVIVLACGNYLRNDEYDREINRIFNVSFDIEKGKHFYNRSNWFYCHYNVDRTRLVIHTRNLSSGVSRILLNDMGHVIKEHLEMLGKTL